MATKTSSKINPLKQVMGPLWNLFSESSCHEILIDSFNSVYSVKGKEIVAEKSFKNSKELDLFIERLLKFSKKKIIEGEMKYFFHLDDYTRINIVLPPLAMKGPSIVISKIPVKKVTLDNLVEWKALDNEGKSIIEGILNSDKGFLVAGNMGSGKMTLFNVLINSIQHPRRIVTLERIPDLIIERPLLARLQSQTQKATEMIELIEIAQRMGADYVALSECVGPEVGPFLEMVRNNSTGLALTTGENVLDAVKRMATKTVLSSDGLTLEEANYALAQTFPYVIFQEKRKDGSRVISSISETSYDNGELKLKMLYKRD